MRSDVLCKPTVTTVRTVSDTKRAFYTQHPRPINSIYRRVVEELMVEMHLLSVNTDFVYEPVYALGMVTTFDRFMAGYLPEADKGSIFNALCHSIQSDPQKYRTDAEALTASVADLSIEDLKGQFANSQSSGWGSTTLQATLSTIANNPKFKYSRLFAIGLYALVEATDATALEDKETREALFTTLSEALKLSSDKVAKDLELYRGNLEKMSQAQVVMQEMIAAERKKREQRAQEMASKGADSASQTADQEDKPEDKLTDSASADSAPDA
jgi:photosystem II biogenesis protein Psp29